MAEERAKSRDAAGIIKEKMKEEMGQYIKEKEKVCYRGNGIMDENWYLCGVINELSVMNYIFYCFTLT